MSAIIGTLTASARDSTTMSAVAERSGRSGTSVSSSVRTTSKSIAACWLPCCWLGGVIAELPISVTSPENSRSGKASMRIEAWSPNEIMDTSVSSTCTTTSISERSEIVSTSDPGLFIVPMMTVSPSSTLSLVTFPVMGALKMVFERRSSASSTPACAWDTP